MSTTVIVLIVVGWIILASLIALGFVLFTRRAAMARGVVMAEVAAGAYAFRTPAGRATARLALHDDHGRVFEVRTYFRGEDVSVSYVPPAAQVLRREVERLAADAVMRRTQRRRVARAR